MENFPFLASLAYWHWLVIGLLFMIIESFFPLSFFLWEGIAALITGGVTYCFDISWPMQFLIFVFSAPIVTIVGRRFVTFYTVIPDQNLLNQRSQQMIGSTFVLNQPIVNGSVQLTIGGSMWKVTGPDLPVGTLVIVTDIQGNFLSVIEKRQHT